MKRTASPSDESICLRRVFPAAHAYRSVWTMGTTALLLVCALMGVSVASAATYTGSLTYAPPAPPGVQDELWVQGVGWPSDSLTVYWEVTDEAGSDPAFPWMYVYRLERGGTSAGYSHVVIEVSPESVLADFAEFSNATVASFGPQTPQSGNPNMPETLYAIRLNPVATPVTDWTFSFVSSRAPVWGDIYIKDGGNPVNCAYNYNMSASGVASGFLIGDEDPSYAPWEGTAENHYFYHILRPDTHQKTPEPLSLVFFGTGIVAAVGFVIRRRMGRI